MARSSRRGINNNGAIDRVARALAWGVEDRLDAYIGIGTTHKRASRRVSTRHARERALRGYFFSFVPQAAPRLIHSVSVLISLAVSFGPGGIWMSLSCRKVSINTLASGFPGTIPPPPLPPPTPLSTSRKDIFPFL